jgi:hypothetical protein
MLVAKVEVWPGGIAQRSQTIGVIEIVNITGSAPVSNYFVTLAKKNPDTGEETIVKQGTVYGFPRNKRDTFELISLALQSCLGTPEDAKVG